MTFFLMQVHTQREKNRETLCLFLFLQKDMNPIMGPQPSWHCLNLISSQNSNTITNIWILEGHKHAAHISRQAGLCQLTFLDMCLSSSLPHQMVKIQALSTLPTISHCVLFCWNRPWGRPASLLAKQTFHQETHCQSVSPGKSPHSLWEILTEPLLFPIWP